MRHLLIALIALLPMISVAQNVDTKINNVTVYRQGALISRSGNVSLKKGDNEITLVNLSTNLSPESIRLGVKNNDVTIVSLLHEFDVETDDAIAKLRDKNAKRKTVVSDSIEILKAQLSVLAETKSLILENKKIGGDQGITSEQLAKMTQFYKNELSDINSRQMKLRKLTENYVSELNTIKQNEQNISKESSKKVSRIRLKLSAPADISNVNISLEYLVFDAQWDPNYEIRVQDVNKPMQLVYQARVRQSSNEKWDNVKLTLSTGDPSLENQKPAFETMYLPPVRRNNTKKTWTRPVANTAFGTVCDSEGEPLIGVMVAEKGTTNGTITDLDGNFKLQMKDTKNKIEFSYVGFEKQESDPGENMQIYLEEDMHEIEEVIVVGYGTSRDSDYADYHPEYNRAPKSSINKTEPKIKANIPLEMKNSLAVNEFQIQIPYTIPADGKDYSVSMITYEMPTEYKYASAPRFSKEVYLMAEVADLYKYSLLKGPAKVYFENIYQGESEIAPTMADDTLKLSIGSDKMLAVDRKELRDKTNKSIIGSNAKVIKTFEITVRNNKEIATDIEIEDQYPIAKNSDIKVALTDNGGAEVDAKTGRLSWKLHLAAHESKVLKFTYEVKYSRYQYNFNVE